MKKFLIFCIVLLNLNIAYGASVQTIRQNPYVNNPYYRHNSYYRNEILPRDLSALEKYSMNRIYPRENSLQRLERLENLAFGSIQSGDMESRYKNVETAILSRPKYNFKRNVIGALSSYFMGQPTGFTPSIYNNYGTNFIPAYDNYNNGLGNTRFNQYSNGIFRGGYSLFNNTLGNGSSIRILD